MKRSRPSHHPKPDLLVLLTFFVGLGVILTSVVQAADSRQSSSILQHPAAPERSRVDQWLPSLWSLDLANRLKNWRPRIAVEESEDGLELSRPFGTRGPVLQFATELPETPLSGGAPAGVSDDLPDAYLFLQQRW